MVFSVFETFESPYAGILRDIYEESLSMHYPEHKQKNYHIVAAKRGYGDAKFGADILIMLLVPRKDPMFRYMPSLDLSEIENFQFAQPDNWDFKSMYKDDGFKFCLILAHELELRKCYGDSIGHKKSDYKETVLASGRKNILHPLFYHAREVSDQIGEITDHNVSEVKQKAQELFLEAERNKWIQETFSGVYKINDLETSEYAKFYWENPKLQSIIESKYRTLYIYANSFYHQIWLTKEFWENLRSGIYNLSNVTWQNVCNLFETTNGVSGHFLIKFDEMLRTGTINSNYMESQLNNRKGFNLFKHHMYQFVPNNPYKGYRPKELMEIAKEQLGNYFSKVEEINSGFTS